MVEQCLTAPVHRDREVLHVERDLTGVDVFLQLVADQAERGVADAHNVTGPDLAPVDRLTVQKGAVVRAEVDDLVCAVRERLQLRVPA